MTCDVYEYDGAFRCDRHKRFWGAIRDADEPCAEVESKSGGGWHWGCRTLDTSPPMHHLEATPNGEHKIMTLHSREDFTDKAKALGVPSHTADALARYVYDHLPPGGFLWAVLANDLHEALFLADDLNRPALLEIARFVYGYLPSSSWGSSDAIRAWTARDSSESAS